MYWLGCGINYPIATWVADKYGRKSGVYVGYILLFLGAVLQTSCRRDYEFVLARLFVGCAAAWLGNCVPLLINEIAYPSQRGITNALFMCGWVRRVSAHWWTTKLTSEVCWRHPCRVDYLWYSQYGKLMGMADSLITAGYGPSFGLAWVFNDTAKPEMAHFRRQNRRSSAHLDRLACRWRF